MPNFSFPSLLLFLFIFLAPLLTLSSTATTTTTTTTTTTITAGTTTTTITTTTKTTTTSTPVKQSKFYIFDWPPYLQYSIPEKSATLIQGTRFATFDHSHAENFGNGKLINATLSLYATNVFQFYHMVMSKLRVHPRRTMNYSEALFYVMPYDIGFNAQFDQSNGAYDNQQSKGCHRHLNESDHIVPLLTNEIQRTGLHGHNILIINSLFDVFSLECLKVFVKCRNCTIVATDLADIQDNQFYTPFSPSTPPMNRRTYSVPFPTSIRWTEEGKTYPWDQQQPAERPIFVTYWGSPAVALRTSTKLRTILAHQCDSRSNLCYHLKPTVRTQNQCLDSSNSSSSIHCQKRSKMSGIEAYLNSIFCLQPPGDSSGRKGIFDSIAAGCIPVLFLNGLLTKAYTWHFTPKMERDISVFIPFHEVVSSHSQSKTVIDILKEIPLEEIRRKQAAIKAIALSLQYAIPPKRMSDYIGYGGGVGKLDGQGVWHQPFDDAVDILLDSMEKLVRNYVRNNFTVIPEERPNNTTGWDYFWKRKIDRIQPMY